MRKQKRNTFVNLSILDNTELLSNLIQGHEYNYYLY
jgi:hypothetical protein